MNKLDKIRVLVFAGLLIFFLVEFPSAHKIMGGQPQSQEETQAWVKATGEKLAPFLPKPPAVLTDRMPWDEYDYNKIRISGGGFGESEYQPVYYIVEASRLWRFADPSLPQLYEKAEAAEPEAMKEAAEYLKQKKDQREARDKKMIDLINRMTDLQMKGQYQEANKIQKELDTIRIENEKENAEYQKIINRSYNMRKEVEAKARFLKIAIETNEEPPFGETAAGKLQGYSIYRRPYGNFDERVKLSVYVGPADFQNYNPSGKQMQREIKSILVTVDLGSTPENLKADEVVAKQVLESIDLAGVAGLINK